MAKSTVGQQRIYAWLIDLLMMAGLSALFNLTGWLVSTVYLLFRDGLFEGQSIGKRLMGLKVVAGKDRAQATFLNSFVRNVLWGIPFVNLAMGFTGLHDLFHDPAGRHWGDRLADTRVIKV